MFDLDGTLHDREATLEAYLRGHVERIGLPAEHRAAYSARFVALDERGDVPKQIVFEALAREFGLSHAVEALFQDFCGHAFLNCAPRKALRETLDELRRRGLELALVSNGQTVKQRGVLGQSGLERAPRG